MGIINKARLDAIAIQYRAVGIQGLKRAPTGLADLAMRFMLSLPSTSAKENLNWIGDVPKMQEWIGDRPLLDLESFGFEIANVNYATGIKLAGDDIEDDSLGMLGPRINTLVEAYWSHVYDQLVALIQAAVAGVACYDGSHFAAADHAEGTSGVQRNYRTGAGSALDAAEFASCRAEMQEFVSSSHNQLGIMPTHLWCGTGLEMAARDILKAQNLANGQTNTQQGLADIIVLPGLASATMWGLVDLSKSLKPFIKLNRRPVTFTAMATPDSEDFFNRREVKFGVDYRGAYGFGFWQTFYLCDGA
jgi:phage major head subunit gpT-like protein